MSGGSDAALLRTRCSWAVRASSQSGCRALRTSRPRADGARRHQPPVRREEIAPPGASCGAERGRPETERQGIRAWVGSRPRPRPVGVALALRPFPDGAGERRVAVRSHPHGGGSAAPQRHAWGIANRCTPSPTGRQRGHPPGAWSPGHPEVLSSSVVRRFPLVGRDALGSPQVRPEAGSQPRHSHGAGENPEMEGWARWWMGANSPALTGDLGHRPHHRRPDRRAGLGLVAVDSQPDRAQR